MIEALITLVLICASILMAIGGCYVMWILVLLLIKLVNVIFD